MGGASGVESSNARDTGRGVTPSSSRARMTARSRRSTLARQPSYNRYVLAALSARGVTVPARRKPLAEQVAPAMTVVLVASSHTVQPDSPSPSGTGIAAGAPGMPSSGPRWAVSIAAGPRLRDLRVCLRSAERRRD